jgi:hypothetical protein
MDFPISHSGRVLHLGVSLTLQFKQILVRYCQESEVRYTALLEESGALCTDAGDVTLRDAGETAALAVGAFAALQAVAQRLGDSTFEGFFHEGKCRHFCLTPVTPQFLLLSVFEAPVRFAIVKVCAAKATTRLQQQIETMPVPPRNNLPAVLSHETGDFSFESGTTLFQQV